MLAEQRTVQPHSVQDWSAETSYCALLTHIRWHLAQVGVSGCQRQAFRNVQIGAQVESAYCYCQPAGKHRVLSVSGAIQRQKVCTDSSVMAADGEQSDSLYAVLNVARDAPDEEIKRRYR